MMSNQDKQASQAPVAEYIPTAVQFLKPIDCIAPGMDRVSNTMEMVDRIEVNQYAVIVWPKRKELGYYKIPMTAVAVIKYAQKQLS